MKDNGAPCRGRAVCLTRRGRRGESGGVRRRPALSTRRTLDGGGSPALSGVLQQRTSISASRSCVSSSGVIRSTSRRMKQQRRRAVRDVITKGSLVSDLFKLGPPVPVQIGGLEHASHAALGERHVEGLTQREVHPDPAKPRDVLATGPAGTTANSPYAAFRRRRSRPLSRSRINARIPQSNSRLALLREGLWSPQHDGWSSWPLGPVSRSRFVPSRSTTKMLCPCSPPAANAIRRPSGDHAGSKEPPEGVQNSGRSTSLHVPLMASVRGAARNR